MIRFKKASGRLRLFTGLLSFVLLVLSMSSIWILTEQTPDQTGALTRWFANVLDDVQRRDEGLPGSGSDVGLSGSLSSASSCSIVGQPLDCNVRVGELVTFRVVANDAVAYLWECTDSGTSGWYQIEGSDATKAKYEFEMTQDLTWMEDCRIRCLVTFADGSSEYSDEALIVIRDVMKSGKYLRRFAHIAEFGAVGFFSALSAVLLLAGAFRRRVLVGGCLVFCMLNSLLDQLHKLFVPGREFDVIDLGLDAIGYVLAISLVFGVWGWFQQSRGRYMGSLFGHFV